MKAAISTVCLHDYPLDENLRIMSEAGFSNVEILAIPGWVHLAPETADAAAILHLAQQHQLHVFALHAGGIDGGTDRLLRDSVAHIRRVVAMAAHLGAALVVFSGMPSPAGERSHWLRAINRGLRELEPYLAEHLVRVGLENHCGCQVETLQDYRAALADLELSPWVGATVDTGHCTASGVDPVEIALSLGRSVFHTHIKDHIGPQSVALGRGQTDNVAFVGALSTIGYTGYLSAELELHDRTQAVAAVRAARPYLENLIGG